MSVEMTIQLREERGAQQIVQAIEMQRAPYEEVVR